MKKIICALMLFSSASAFAGAAQVEVRCESKDKTVLVTASVPGDMLDFEINVTVNGKTESFMEGVLDENEAGQVYNKTNAKVGATVALKDGVLAISGDKAGPKEFARVQLYALPKTVVVKPLPYHGEGSTFTGKLFYGSDALGGKPPIQTTVSCTSRYQI